MSKKPGSQDRALFRKAVGDVRPVTDNSIIPVFSNPPPQPRQRRLDEKAVLTQLKDLTSGTGQLETQNGLHYQKPGLSPHIFKRLRRGQYSVGAELDLHGMNSETARQSILDFLDECQQHEVSCAKIIHGKGLRSSHSGPVLKQLSNSLLRRHSEVLAFASAKANDGGTGALYVLIKRY